MYSAKTGFWLIVFSALLRPMLKGLQNKWKVNGWQLVLIIATFALGGSLTGYAGRKILDQFHLSHGWERVTLFILLVTLLWPVAVIFVSVPLGQFTFFRAYIHKIGKRFKLTKNGQKRAKKGKKRVNIAIFASGTGSNAQKIIDHFRGYPGIKTGLVVSNNPHAGVLNIAIRENIPILLIDKKLFLKKDAFLPFLVEKGIDFIVLAGFLWKIPDFLISAYPRKIINIHPALLPKYGGKGMYGHFVHEAVLAGKETESGITIHYVDELYDHGQVIKQVKCTVAADDTPETLAARVHALEHANYPGVIEDIIRQTLHFT